jgi:hypothetical protein
MEVYILDSLYRRVDVVDVFDSLIWTERFSAYGDFELKLHSTLANRTKFKEGVKLAIHGSYRVMTVETVEDSTDNQGLQILSVKGTSMESVLVQRLALAALTDTTTDPKWSLTGTPVEIATQMFHDICVTGTLDPGDVIPMINEGSIFPADTIPAPPDDITYEVDPTTLYEAIKNLCDQYLLGFRLVRNLDLGQLYFDVYTGSDRTTHQTSLPAVVFSPSFDNLTDTTELTSVAAYKNVAYVISPVGHAIVYPQDVDPDTEGFERRVLLVNATDITETDPTTATALMTQRGYEELAKYRRISAFDGEISQNSKFVYGRDYNLGDLVEVRNTDGVGNTMQVTEHIFVSDKEGDRSYPTLSVTEFVTPGSWLSEPPTRVWFDYDSDSTTWADQL